MRGLGGSRDSVVLMTARRRALVAGTVALVVALSGCSLGSGEQDDAGQSGAASSAVAHTPPAELSAAIR